MWDKYALIVLTVSGLMVGGCAPRTLDQAINYYVDREHVRDAAARRTNAAWYLRFDSATLHDLDTAIEGASRNSGRELALQALRAAGDLAIHATHSEVERLSPDARRELANRTNAELRPEEILNELKTRQKRAIEDEISTDQRLDAGAFQLRLREIRNGVEPLPDDRERLSRRVLFGAFLPMVKAGIEKQENNLHDAVRHHSSEPVASAEIWQPAAKSSDLRVRWAPVIAVESPAFRDYPEDYDRIGSVALSGTRDRINVWIDPSRPSVYCYESTALIYGKRHKQLAYVWWFPERPSMMQDDAAAGHIDGGTLRLTLDDADTPAIAEIILNCGCGHEVYVSDRLEAAARGQFGSPMQDARYAVELRTPDRRPVFVAGVFAAPSSDGRAIVVLEPGTHDPRRFACGASRSVVRTACATHSFELADYETLDHLALGDGWASMFGPDGLVHNAGRREGYWLAPTGMMSAGQPRKRGTQRVRWDEYVFDDPEFLSKTLRIPCKF